MNIIDAVKSGKPFTRPCYNGLYFVVESSVFEVDEDDIIANDWVLKEDEPKFKVGDKVKLTYDKEIVGYNKDTLGKEKVYYGRVICTDHKSLFGTPIISLFENKKEPHEFLEYCTSDGTVTDDVKISLVTYIDVKKPVIFMSKTGIKYSASIIMTNNISITANVTDGKYNRPLITDFEGIATDDSGYLVNV